MAGLQRFITYIYKYENNEKKENAGFAKIEIRGTVCRVEVHIRNISMEQPEATVYLFAREQENIQGIPVGNIEISRGNGDVRYAFDTKELLNFGKTMRDMEGIFIPFGENQEDISMSSGETLFLASQWKEGPIERQMFHILEKKKTEEAGAQVQHGNEHPNAETTGRSQADRESNTHQREDIPQTEGSQAEKRQPENTYQDSEQPGNNHRNHVEPRNNNQNSARLGNNRQNLARPGNNRQNPIEPEYNTRGQNSAGPGNRGQAPADSEIRDQMSAGAERRIQETVKPEGGGQAFAAGAESRTQASAEPENSAQASAASENSAQASAEPEARSQESLQAESLQQEFIPENQKEAGMPQEPQARQPRMASMPNIPLPRRQGAFRGRRNIRATELPMEDFFEDAGWERMFQKLRLKLDIFFPFEGQEIECVRMQLNDLQEFPKKYWYLGNNSFLLHGFFNYRHIIFGERKTEDKKEYLIGVPGVFQNQERIMASMFGFPEFCTAKNTEYKTGNFGYWYRIL